MLKGKVVVYGIMGEGLGHARRSQAIINRLVAAGHRVHVLTSGDAFTALKESSYPDLHRVYSFSFIYESERIHHGLTLWRHAPALLALLTGTGRAYQVTERLIRQLKPDCVITDFEPYTARIAQLLGIPLVSIDHQHILADGRIPELDVPTRLAVRISDIVIRHIFRVDLVIVAGFYHFETRSTARIMRVYNILRDEIVGKPEASIGQHVTVYLKRHGYWERVRKTLAALPSVQFQVFSDFSPLNVLEQIKSLNVEIFPISDSLFVSSLKSCQALISTAGNQALGEAIYLHKPVLCFPEPNAFEQEINGRALEATGAGRVVELEHLDARTIEAFLSDLDRYRERIKEYLSTRPDFNATKQVVDIINGVLAAG